MTTTPKRYRIGEAFAAGSKLPRGGFGTLINRLTTDCVECRKTHPPANERVERMNYERRQQPAVAAVLEAVRRTEASPLLVDELLPAPRAMPRIAASRQSNGPVTAS